MIEIKISSSVTEEQRKDLRFLNLHREAKEFFNCNKSCCFSEKYRNLLCLHEGGHAYFAKKAGATDVVFHGPQMLWDYRPQYGYDCPAISRASTVWTLDTDSVIEYVKASVAGYVCRREMSDEPNDAVAISQDVDSARDWYQRHVGGTEEFQQAVADADEAVMKDLQSSTVREEIWAEAKRFQQEIFPAPKLTSGLLRARRLGLGTWTATAV